VIFQKVHPAYFCNNETAFFANKKVTKHIAEKKKITKKKNKKEQ